MPQITRSQLPLYIDVLGHSIDIPILQVESNQAGPHTVLTALNHGDEVISLETGINIVNQASLDPTFKGKITFITALNIEGFKQVERLFVAENYHSGGKFNLNRVFNGNNTNFTTMVANKIFNFITDQKPDFVVDLHSFAQNSLVHLILDRPNGQLEKNMIEISKKTKIPFYLEFEAKTAQEQKLDFALSNQLCLKNICAFTLELGPKRGFSLDQSNLASQALANIISVFGHINKEIGHIYPQLTIDTNTLYNRISIGNDSLYSGYFKPLVRIGEKINPNTRIADIINLQGQVIHSVYSPSESGYIIAFEEESIVYPYRNFITMMIPLV